MSVKILSMTGATGFVGGATLEKALAAGWQVRALTRRAQAARPGVTWVQGSLEQKDALARLVEGSSAILHIAGVVNAPNKQGFVDGNVAATQAMLDVAAEEGTARFVHVSSLSAREPKLSVYGWSKAEGENLVTASDRAWTVVRPPAVFGPRDTEMLDLFRMAQRGAVLAPKGRMSAIYVEDLARLLIALADDTTGTSMRAIYEPDDGRDGGWTHKEFGKAIAEAVDRKHVLTINVPENLLHGAAMLDEKFRGAKAKLTKDRANYIAHPDWMVTPSARPPASLWSPATSTSDALRATVAWYRQEQWI